MASSLDMPKTPRKAPVRKKKNEGRPEGITKLLAEFRFERVARDPQMLEREVRQVVGSLIIFRTADTPPGTRDGEGTPTAAEFVILDDEGKWIERDTAETWGKAEEYGRAFAERRQLQLVDARLPFRPSTTE